MALTNSGAGRNTEFVYEIGATTSNNFAKTTTHGHTANDCPMQMDCEYYNEDSQSWETYTDPPMKVCSMAGGLTFELESTDASVASYRPERNVSMRIVYTSTSSNLSADEGAVAIDYFNLHVREECYDFGITLTTGLGDISYLVQSSSTSTNQEAVFSLSGDSGSNDCTISYTVQIKEQGQPESSYVDISDAAYNTWLAKSSTVRGNYGITITATDTAAWPEPKTYDVWVRVEGSSTYASHADANATFTLTMQNYCYSNAITCASTSEIADFLYEIPVVHSPATERTVPSASTCTGTQGGDSTTCAQTTTLEHYDTSTKTWANVDSTYITSTLPFISALTASSRTLKA